MLQSCITKQAHAIIPGMRDYLKTPPTPEQIAAAREKAQQTMEEAADVIGGTTSRSTWSRWESGAMPMAPHTFDYYLLRTGQKKL